MEMGNISQAEIQGQLTDKTGRAYHYMVAVSGDFHDWRVLDRERRVGYAWCWLRGDDFQIADWKFADEVPMPRSLWAQMLGRPAEIRSYRCRGLGTQLMPLIIAHARQYRAHRITGRIAPHDLAAFPDLPDWYRRFGFTFTLGSAEPAFAGKIELML